MTSDAVADAPTTTTFFPLILSDLNSISTALELTASVHSHSHSKLLNMHNFTFKFLEALKVWHRRFCLVSVAERYLVVLSKLRLSVNSEV